MLVVLAFAMPVFAMPEEPAETEDVELVEKLEQVAVEQADEDEIAAAEEEVKAAESDSKKAAAERRALSRRKAAVHERALLTNRQHMPAGPLPPEHPVIPAVGGAGYAGRVLVIPDEDIGTGQLLATMEDMNIMSRIIDKKLGQTHLAQEHAVHLLYMASAFDRSASEPRSIYLDGYGALFLSKVDFPLSPAPKTEEEGPTDGFDPLWEQTKQEMYRVPEEYQPPWSSSEKVAEYDAEKVEELKRKLIRTLKHAANIRGLDGGDWIVISITGSGRRSPATAVIRSYVDKDGKVITKTEKRATMPSESYSPTVLTIRASKSDVDEFAEGNLDFDGFRERVQIFTY
jgi:hypothetical protein